MWSTFRTLRQVKIQIWKYLDSFTWFVTVPFYYFLFIVWILGSPIVEVASDSDEEENAFGMFYSQGEVILIRRAMFTLMEALRMDFE